MFTDLLISYWNLNIPDWTIIPVFMCLWVFVVFMQNIYARIREIWK